MEKELHEATVRLEQYQHQRERLENRINDFKEVQRRKRNHRLITRGAAVESITPEVKGMGEAEFYSLMENILSLLEVASLVSRAKDRQEDD